jgi:hypothetical protein
MKRLIGTVLVLVLLPHAARVRGADYSKGHGYVYAAPGAAGGLDAGAESIIHIGAGAEGFFHKYLGIGADVGYVAPLEEFKGGVGTFSPNLVARFYAQGDQNRVEPFVTGGYTLFLHSGRTANGGNFGGGFNWWFKGRLGLRFELRDNIWSDGADLYHIAAFRVGLTFR